MRTCTIAVLLAVVLVAALPARAQDRSADEAAVFAAERAVCAAYEREDADWLAQHLDAAFTLTSSRGEVTTRAQEVAELRGGKVRYEVFRNHGSTVRFYGDTAVVNGITTVKGSAEGAPFAADFRFTDVYVRGEDAWRLVASHASRLTAPAP